MTASLQRVFADHRSVMVPLAIGLITNVVVYAVGVYPLSRRVRAATTRTDEASQVERNAETIYGRAVSLAEGKARADDELRTFYKDVLPRGLAGARRITYVRLANLAAETGLHYERRTVRSELERDGTLAKLEMTMVLAGAYEDVRRFIYRLETSPEFLVIEDVSLAQAEEGEAPLVLTLNVSTYYVPDDDDS